MAGHKTRPRYPELKFSSNEERYAWVVLPDGRETYVIDGKQAGYQLVDLLLTFNEIGRTDHARFSRMLRHSLAMEEDGGLLALYMSNYSFDDSIDLLFRHSIDTSGEPVDWSKVPHHKWPRLRTERPQ